MTTATKLEATDARVPSYRRYGVTFTHGKGSWLFDSNGKRYLDFLTGIAVNALGHAHERLVEAIRDQAGKLIHISNLYEHPLQNELAERLADACELDLVFFCNSGTEAIEAGIKMARAWQRSLGQARTKILALEHGFHGRTCGAVSCTWEPSYREPFEPLLPGVDFVPREDSNALKKALETGQYAVLLAEPIQGESGVLPLSREYLEYARSMTEGTGTLLLFDEIQCGGGRTGSFLASQHTSARADIVTLAKPIGGGLPIGATVARREVGEALQPGMHGSTFAGGALACRAGLVFMEELFDRGLLEHVRAMGDKLRAGLQTLVEKHECCKSVRGAGLMQALVLDIPTGDMARELLENGLLVNATGGNVLRLLPPFVLQDDELEHGVRLLDEVIAAHTSR